MSPDRPKDRPDTREQEEIVRDQLYGPESRTGDDIPPPEEVPPQEGAPPTEEGTEEEPAAEAGPPADEQAAEDVPPPETFAGRLARDESEPKEADESLAEADADAGEHAIPEEPDAAAADRPPQSGQETVEADVLAASGEGTGEAEEVVEPEEDGEPEDAGDAEEAEAAAHRALEEAAAREAGGAAAEGTDAPAADGDETEAPAPATAAGKAAQAAAAGAAAADAVGPSTEVAPTAEPAPPADGGVAAGMQPAAAGGPPPDDPDAKPPKPGLWPRFLAASFVIVISMAAATSTSLLLYLSDIAEGLGGIGGVEGPLADVDGGEPQTILILGSDVRPEIEDRGRSDTTMLLRLDADRNVLALWSLPRDLEVQIPGRGPGRLNEAYSLGGPKLTLETVKALTGLEIAHLVVVDFTGFARAVDAIGCVYVDVDRDYFHSNEGLAVTEQYSEIDIDSGYQRLCGPDALAYVRYRHEDNDIVRAARQQDFLREARAKVPPEAIWEDRNQLIDIFTDYVSSDVDDPVVMLEVLKLFVDVREVPVQRVDFETDIGGPGEPYVTVSDEAIQDAREQFLGEGPPEEAASRGGGGGPKAGGGDDKPDPENGGEPDPPELIDASEAAERFALEFDDDLHFPVYAPTKLAPGSVYYDDNDDSHTYGLDALSDETYGAYKLVFLRSADTGMTAFGADEYYGVTGTRWEDPPILDNPTSTIELDGREYLLFYDGGRLRLVGWKEEGASYWVTNTLTRSLDEDEMLGIARSMQAYSPER
jgi:LCP family protein required for cell wall assembly